MSARKESVTHVGKSKAGSQALKALGFLAAIIIIGAIKTIQSSNSQGQFLFDVLLIPLWIGFLYHLTRAVHVYFSTNVDRRSRAVPLIATGINSNIGTEDDFWAKALEEFESQNKRLGLWAKLISEAHGNESLAKAMYLKLRSSQLSEERELQIRDEALRQQEAIERRLTHGVCPNCDEAILLNSKECPKCHALFGASDGWQIKQFSMVSDNIDAK